MKGCVYFFRHIGLIPVKIGFTDSDSPESRFQQFKTYAPYGAEILGVIISDNPFLLEKKIHNTYSNLRLEGEWFNISKKQVEDLISKHSTIEEINAMNNFQIEWSKRNLTQLHEACSIFPEGCVDFISKLKPNSRIEKKQFAVDLSKNLGVNIPTSTSMKYVKLYCDIKGFKFISGHSGNIYWFVINLKIE